MPDERGLKIESIYHSALEQEEGRGAAHVAQAPPPRAHKHYLPFD